MFEIFRKKKMASKIPKKNVFSYNNKQINIKQVRILNLKKQSILPNFIDPL